MLRLKLFQMTLCLISYAHIALSKDLSVNVINKVVQGQKAIFDTGSPPTVGCGDKSENVEVLDRDVGTSSIIDINNTKIEISTVSVEYLNELFHEIAANREIPFGYPEDGCYARAHKMSMLLEEKGIVSAKVFIEGKLRVETEMSPNGYVQWWYHVAPIVKVRNGEREEIYVIDPSIFTKPVPVEEWFLIQTKHKEGVREKTYQTKRFNYIPSSKSTNLEEYQFEDTNDMIKTLNDNLHYQNSKRLRR